MLEDIPRCQLQYTAAPARKDISVVLGLKHPLKLPVLQGNLQMTQRNVKIAMQDIFARLHPHPPRNLCVCQEVTRMPGGLDANNAMLDLSAQIQEQPHQHRPFAVSENIAELDQLHALRVQPVGMANLKG